MMPRYFLTRLAVEGFRGINNENDPLDIGFEPKTPLVEGIARWAEWFHQYQKPDGQR